MTRGWITLEDHNGERVDVRKDRIARLDVLDNVKAKTCVCLDTPENASLWVRQTVDEIHALMDPPSEKKSETGPADQAGA